MNDMLATMWNSLSLTKNEAITLEIDNNKLSVPKNALMGKLAMRKHVSTFEVDKGLKSIWEANNDLETTLIGNNLFLFAFNKESTCDRVFDKQPWNFCGSLVLLERIIDDECPTNVTLHSVPF